MHNYTNSIPATANMSRLLYSSLIL